MLLCQLLQQEPRLQLDQEDIDKYRFRTAKIIWEGKYVWISDGNKGVNLHSLLLGKKPGFIIDHIDRDWLNNKRSNLRHCTSQENSRNMSCHTDSTSQYKGVCWAKDRNRWRVTIWTGKKQHHIGFFKDELLAARAYDRKAKELFGEFAAVNFP